MQKIIFACMVLLAGTFLQGQGEHVRRRPLAKGDAQALVPHSTSPSLRVSHGTLPLPAGIREPDSCQPTKRCCKNMFTCVSNGGIIFFNLLGGLCVKLAHVCSVKEDD